MAAAATWRSSPTPSSIRTPTLARASIGGRERYLARFNIPEFHGNEFVEAAHREFMELTLECVVLGTTGIGFEAIDRSQLSVFDTEVASQVRKAILSRDNPGGMPVEWVSGKAHAVLWLCGRVDNFERPARCR